MEAIGCRLLTLEFERTLQTDTDQELKVMGETGDKRQQLLGNAEFSNSGLLGFRQEREEGNNLLAEEFGFSSIRQF